MKRVDRLMLGYLLPPLAALSGVVVLLLALENMTRMAGRIEGVAAPFRFLLLSSAFLLPEHLAVALPVVLFLAVGLAIRQMGLRAELVSLWSFGLSPTRVLLVPMTLALLLRAAHLGLRGYVEPIGERHLDGIGQALKTGDLGVRLQAGVPQQVAPGVLLLADRVDADDLLQGVLIQAADTVYAARSARLVNGGSDGASAHLIDGTIVRPRRDGRAAVHFADLDVSLAALPTAAPGRTAVDAMDRKSDSSLARISSAAGPHQAGARLELASRVVQSLILLLTPLIALPLSVPARGAQSPVGLFAGLAIVAGAIAMSNGLNGSPGPLACLLQAGIGLVVAVIAFSFWRATRYQPDRIALALARIVRRLEPVTRRGWRRTAHSPG